MSARPLLVLVLHPGSGGIRGLSVLARQHGVVDQVHIPAKAR